MSDQQKDRTCNPTWSLMRRRRCARCTWT